MGLVINISFYNTPIFPAQVLKYSFYEIRLRSILPNFEKGLADEPSGLGMDYRRQP
jgi:hypothetical protein